MNNDLSPQSAAPPGGADVMNLINKSIDESIGRLVKDATERERWSSRQRFWDKVFRATTAILAVAAPALVTYSTTPNVAEPYKLAAIILAGVAGASATLQSIFALQQGYVRNAIDALELYEVKAKLESDRQEALQKGNEFEKYAALRIALTDAIKNHKKIIFEKRKEYLSQLGAEQQS